MIKPVQYKGEWWLPENPENRVYGDLKYHPTDGTVLELFGSLQGNGFELPRMEIVLGELNNGKPITLFNCYQSNFSLSVYALTRAPGFQITKIRANYIFEGQHFRSNDDIKFQSLTFGLSHLKNWAQNTRIKASRESPTLSYERPDDIKIEVPQVGDLIFQYSSSISHGLLRASIENKVDLKLEAQEPVQFEAWWKSIYLLRAFFSFATSHAVHPTHMHEVRPIELELPDGTIQNTFLQTDVFFQVGEIPDESSTEGPSDMLFVMRDVGEELESCIQNWFSRSELLKPVYDLYFGTLHNSNMYPIHQFLSLAQALETYHRRASDRTLLPKKEHKDKMKEILANVPEQYVGWLRESLAFSNDLTLRDRLSELMQVYVGIFGQVPNLEDFISKVVSTRNYLTHYGVKLEAKAAQGNELYLLSQSLKMLMEMCLLKELGLSDDKVRHITLRDKQKKHWFEHPKSPIPNAESGRL